MSGGKSTSNGDTPLESLQIVFLKFLIIISFFRLKRTENINYLRVATCCGPQIVQKNSIRISFYLEILMIESLTFSGIY